MGMTRDVPPLPEERKYTQRKAFYEHRAPWFKAGTAINFWHIIIGYFFFLLLV